MTPAEAREIVAHEIARSELTINLREWTPRPGISDDDWLDILDAIARMHPSSEPERIAAAYALLAERADQ